jgi:hypothetical protein
LWWGKARMFECIGIVVVERLNIGFQGGNIWWREIK